MVILYPLHCAYQNNDTDNNTVSLYYMILATQTQSSAITLDDIAGCINLFETCGKSYNINKLFVELCYAGKSLDESTLISFLKEYSAKMDIETTDTNNHKSKFIMFVAQTRLITLATMLIEDYKCNLTYKNSLGYDALYYAKNYSGEAMGELIANASSKLYHENLLLKHELSDMKGKIDQLEQMYSQFQQFSINLPIPMSTSENEDNYSPKRKLVSRSD